MTRSAFGALLAALLLGPGTFPALAASPSLVLARPGAAAVRSIEVRDQDRLVAQLPVAVAAGPAGGTAQIVFVD